MAVDANKLLDEIGVAKVNLWKYLSVDNCEFLPMDVVDFREEQWHLDGSGKLSWMMGEESGKWIYNAEADTLLKRDGLTFILFDDGDSLTWVVFDDEKEKS